LRRRFREVGGTVALSYQVHQLLPHVGLYFSKSSTGARHWAITGPLDYTTRTREGGS